MPRSALVLQRLLLLAGAGAALTGVLAGLARVGIAVGWGPSYGAWHGPFLVLGLFVTLISLERAVALGSAVAVAVPVLGVLTGAALLLRLPVVPGLAVACASGLVVVNALLVGRHPSLFGVVTWAGSGVLLLGNIAWAAGRPIFDVVPTWIAFLVLTIVGERLRWSRAAVVPRWATRVLVALTAVFGLAACARTLGVGAAGPVLGASTCLIAAWQLRFDVARQTLVQPARARYIALGVLAGMAWLAVAGLLLITRRLPPAGPLYDAVLHAVLVGYVMSTVFAHAPTMLSAVAALNVPFTPILYAPLGLLHASLIGRVAGDLGDVLALRRLGSIGNALAMALFVVIVTGSSAFASRCEATRSSRPASTGGPPDMARGRRVLSRDQRSIIVLGMLAFVVILVVLQLWLLTATTNAYLGGDHSVVWPAAFASLGCLALNIGLLRYLYRMERGS